MKPRIKVPVGARYGQWTVLREGERASTENLSFVRAGRRTWLCRCDCGVEHDVGVAALRSGGTTRCKACAARHASARRSAGRKLVANPGDTFGAWTVIEECLDGSRRAARCRCACGTVRVVRVAALVHGDRTCCRECCKAAKWAAAQSRGKLHFIAGVGTDVRSDVGFFSSELCPTWDDAAAWLADVCDLDGKQRAALKRDGFLRLRGAVDGAAYVEIMRCECATPHVHSDSVTAGAAE
jgi:hypothetical protein